VIALSRGGRVAALEIAEPWTVRASADLGATVASARCLGARCVVVHPSPADSLSLIATSDLTRIATIALEAGADPRDVAFIDDHTLLVSQYGRSSLLEVDLPTGATTPIDLSALADDDGLPEAQMLARCGSRVFVQLRRVDHETGAPSSIGSALAELDLDGSVVQSVVLPGQPDFDMPADCEAGVLYVATPAQLMMGGGAYQQVDLTTLTVTEFLDPGSEVGGFEVLDPDHHWTITHTEFGPGPSSHLVFVGGPTPDTHNTFAIEHVDDLALDREIDLLFYPDPCGTVPSTGCSSRVHVFHASTGARASAEGIDVGFDPIEVTIAR
jgi:hypothetical protein